MKSQVKKNIFFKQEHIGMLICCVFCFLLHVVVINQFNGWFCTDTDGYWLHAATFTGHDWSGVASKVSMYYAWGYSVLLVIPMLLADDILVMSQIAVMMNALLCALTILLLYSVGKKLFAEADKCVLMAAAFITSLYSSYFLGTAVALAEVFIYFLYVLLIWLVLQYMDRKKWYLAILSSVCCGYLYITHHRNLGMVVALLFLAFVLLIKNHDWRELLCFLIPLLLMFALDTTVNDWLKAKEMLGSVYTTNTYGAMGNKVLHVINLKGLISLVQSVLGELWYMLAGTFTIAGIGVAYIVRSVIKQNENQRNMDILFGGKFIYVMYLFLNIVMTIGVSAIFCMRNTNVQSRIDVIFYGRYFECTIGIFLFAGLVALSMIRCDKTVLKDARIIVFITICLSIVIHFFAKEITGNNINYFSVVAVLFPFSHPNLNFTVATSSICLLSIGALIIMLFSQKELLYRILAYVLIGGCFIYIGYNATINTREIYAEQASVVNYPVYNEEFLVISQCVEELDLKTLYVYTEDGYVAFSYQLFHPDTKIITVKSMEEISGCLSENIILPIGMMEDWNISEVLMETPNYVLGRLKNEL